MRILHINSYFNGGTFYRHLFDEQVARGLEMTIIVPVPKDRALLSDIFGADTMIRPSFYHMERYLFHLKSHHIYRDLIENVEIKDHDLTHAHTLFTNGHVAYKLKKKFGLPYMVTVRNTDINTFFRKMRFLRLVGVKILKEADQISFLSEAYLEMTLEKYIPAELQSSIRKKSSVIGNGLDPFWLENRGIAKSIKPDETLHLLAVGNISRNKNIGATLKVMDLLSEKGVKVHLHAVGKIRDQELHQSIIDHPDATYYSYMNKEKLINLYRKSHIFILPSHQETFGNVYPEALSQGLPIIYTKNQGFYGQFEEGEVGFGVDSNSTADICEKILKVTKYYSEFSERALKGAGKYRWENIAKDYIHGYESMVNK